MTVQPGSSASAASNDFSGLDLDAAVSTHVGKDLDVDVLMFLASYYFYQKTPLKGAEK